MKKKRKGRKNGREMRWRNASAAYFGLALSSIVLVLCVPNTKKGFSNEIFILSNFFVACVITRASLFIIRAPPKRKMIAFLKK